MRVIHVPQGGAATSVSDGIGPKNYCPDRLRVGVAPGQSFGREKALHHQVNHSSHSALENSFPAGIPICSRSKLRRSVGQNQSAYTIRGMNGEPLANRPSQRQSTESELRNLERIGKTDHIAP